MRENFYRLYQFNHWANKRLAEVLKSDYCEEGAKLLSHVVNAELIWYGRIKMKLITLLRFGNCMNLFYLRFMQLKVR